MSTLPQEIKYSDVHTVHCCAIHGCKYGYDVYDRRRFGVKLTCTVVAGEHKQQRPCEQCNIAFTGQPRFVVIGGKMARIESDINQVREQLEAMTHWVELLTRYAGDRLGSDARNEIQTDISRAYTEHSGVTWKQANWTSYDRITVFTETQNLNAR